MGEKLGAGFVAGFTAAVVMTLLFLLLRYFFGVATPSELVGDRIAPLLAVDRFLELLDRFGGYNQLKQIGVMSVIAGQLVVGALGGLLYGFIVARSRTIQPEPAGNHGRLFHTDGCGHERRENTH